MDGQSLDIQKTKLDELKQLFPELFSENKLDWEKLKRQAQRNLEDGYQRVLSFPAKNGGL